MKGDFCILGVNGLQGVIVAEKLLQDKHKIIGIDKYDTKVKGLKTNSDFKFKNIDVADELIFSSFLTKLNCNIIINCCDMHLNTFVYKQCLQHKKHCIDLGSSIFDTKKQLKLNSQFNKNNIIGITGCGSVPGIGNIMVKHLLDIFGSFDTIHMGFAWDSNIKNFVIPFSLKSILEECTANPIYIKNNTLASAKPFEIVKHLDLTAVGKQLGFVVHHPETFTLFKNFNKLGVKNINFYASFPKHSMEKIKFLIDLGFSNHTPVQITSDVKISPIELLGPVTNSLVSPINYTETENLWVEVFFKNTKTLMECIVPPISKWEHHGCNVDTGFPAAIIAQQIFNKTITKTGSFAPEEVITPKPFFKELQNYGFRFLLNKQPIDF